MKTSTLCLTLGFNLLMMQTVHAENDRVHNHEYLVLSVDPNRLQFFGTDRLSFNCEGSSGSDGRRLQRDNKGKAEICPTDWGKAKGSSCIIQGPFVADSGVYWCESGDGKRRSNAVNITVTDGAVILESPVLPVTEGSDVTLRCLFRDKTTGKTSSDLPTDFYKDGSLIRTESTGQMTIHNVSQSDEGFYKCIISDLGESPESRVDVRDIQAGLHSSSPLWWWVRLCLLSLVLLVLLAVILWTRLSEREAHRMQQTASLTRAEKRKGDHENRVLTEGE